MQIKNLSRYALIILGLLKDEQLGFRLVTALGKRVLPNYKFSWPELLWFENFGLNKVLDRFNEKDGFNAHRRLALQQLLRLTTSVPGDTAECGAYIGCGSYIILQSKSHKTQNRYHHIFDSFEGLSEPNYIDGSYWNRSDLKVSEDVLSENLAEFDKVNVYKGWIPQRFSEVADRKFSFVHIDVDLYEPTFESIKFFYDRLNEGGVLVCDDYAFKTCPGATAAINTFLSSKPEKMLLLAGGGGFFIKGTVTDKD